MSRHPTPAGVDALTAVDHGRADRLPGPVIRDLDTAGWIVYGVGGYRLTPAGRRALDTARTAVQ